MVGVDFSLDNKDNEADDANQSYRAGTGGYLSALKFHTGLYRERDSRHWFKL